MTQWQTVAGRSAKRRAASRCVALRSVRQAIASFMFDREKGLAFEKLKKRLHNNFPNYGWLWEEMVEETD
jgi:hypothetical protein